MKKVATGPHVPHGSAATGPLHYKEDNISNYYNDTFPENT